MKPIKKYLQSIRRYSFPKTRALEQELDEARESQATVSADLAKIRIDLQRAHEADAQLLADLQQQLGDIESERTHTRDRVENLERLLAETVQGQEPMEKHMDSLRARLEEEGNKVRDQVENLGRLLAETGQLQKSMQTRVDSLEARLEEERGNAREQVRNLERSLTEAGQRLQSTAAHVGSLETKFGEAHKRHETGVHATETTLARIQDEQQSLRALHTELAKTVHEAATRHLESGQAETKKPQRSLLKIIIIVGILFAGGSLVGMFAMQRLEDSRQNMALLKRDIRDMYLFMNQHVDHQETLLNELTLAVNRQKPAEPAPVIIMPQEDEARTQAAGEQPQKTVSFTPDIRELQASLITLGFDLGMSQPNGELGIKTRQALQEFGRLYLPPGDAREDLISEPLVAMMLKSADLVRMDAARFNTRRDVLAAIRLGSIRTGVDFSFLMELARVESNFNPTARAPKSTATGLFQFRDHSWLEAIRTFGAEYGLKDYAAQLELIDDAEHEQQPIVRDPLQLEVLALRLNPRLSTLMAAENIKRNLWVMSNKAGAKPGRTDLYLSHYLGPDGAVMFLETLDKTPDAIAGDIFPEEAARDPGVFKNRQGQPRTLAGVYRWFERKFNTGRYGERSPG